MDELQKRIKSFAYAFTGIGSFLRKEHNAWIHCIAIIIVTITGFIIGSQSNRNGLRVLAVVSDLVIMPPKLLIQPSNDWLIWYLPIIIP